MNEKEKKAIEYLKTRLHGNEGCKYIDVSQEDLRIFINLVDRKEKDIEGWKKYCEEIEEEQTEMSNKNCELEFEIEKLQKENKELKNFRRNFVDVTDKELKEANDYFSRKYTFMGDELAQHINTLLKVTSNSIPIQKVKDKIEELQKGPLKINENNKYYFETEAYNKIIIQVLQELLEGRK